MLTFGLLSPNKGIENVILALPAILESHENVVYIVSGATHPHIRRRDGEQYRESLRPWQRNWASPPTLSSTTVLSAPRNWLNTLGQRHLHYPYRQEAQVVSGTLAIALGAGKAIISTPYWHAKELLADGRGVIVPFDDPPRSQMPP